MPFSPTFMDSIPKNFINMTPHSAPMNSTVSTSPRLLSRIRRRASICAGSIGAELPAPRFSAARRSLAIASLTAALSAAGLFALSGSAQAASQTWRAIPTDATWAGTGNWGASGVVTPPGNTTLTYTTGDIATFNTAVSGGFGSSATPIVIDASRTITGITFDTATVGAFTIGTNAGNKLTLSAAANGSNSIQMTATAATSQVIAAPIGFVAPSSTNGQYTFQNNSTTTAATLTLSGAITNNSSSTRPTGIILAGTNTGANTISGAIAFSAYTGTQNVPLLTKNGAGTWILSGANSFTGVSETTLTATSGVQVNAGVLSLRNNAALGTNGTANTNVNNYINNGGTLELANNITLDNGLVLQLNSGGTIRSSGSTVTNARINLSTAAAVSATLSTVGSSDVFTVGNGASDFTGGAADTVVHIAGPGTVLLNQSSAYAGTMAIDAGTLELGSSTALGAATTAGVTFGASSTGKLQLNNNSTTLVSLTSNATPGTPVVENGTAGTATLTVNNASANTFAGVMQNGAAGTLAVTKGAAGVLTLSGASTYTGATTVSAGTLNVTGSLASGSAVGVSSGGTLGGSGTAAGVVTVSSGGHIAPGNAGIGTLTVGSVTLSAGSLLDYDITNTSTLDKITVSSSGGLTINGGQLNINGGGSAFTSNGVYNLIGYTGAIGGTGTGALTVNSNNQNLATNTYAFGSAGGFVTLTISNAAVTADYWNVNADGNWGTGGNWTAGVPNAVSAFAAFGGGGTTITAPRTATVDGAYTVGTLTFNNPTQAYTLAAGTGGAITLDNGATGSFVSDTAGSHSIQVPLAMTANGATFTVSTSTDTLSVSGAISGTGSVLTKSGAGTLALTGVNTYTGGTVVGGGTIAINSATSLGDVAGAATINAGTLQATGDITTARNINLGNAASTISVDATKTYAISGIVADAAAAGTLNKTGLGTLALTGVNTYTGGTVITAGTLSVNADAALGAVPGAAAPNITFNPGAGNTATLQAAGTLNLSANRSLVLSSGTAAIDTQANTVTLNGASSGSGVLSKSGTGTLTIASGQGYTGGTVINAGKLNIQSATGSAGSLTGGITLNNGSSFAMTSLNSILVNVGNAITVSGTTAFSSNATGNGYSGALTGDANSVINLTAGAGASNFSASATSQFTNFLGTVNVVSGSSMDARGTTAANGGVNTTFNVDGFVSTKNAGSWTFGALSSTGATGTLGGTDNYIVGAKNLSTTYAGNITTNATTGLTKNGTGTLTLTGTGNTYTGLTVISAGTLQIGNGGTIGSLGTGAVTDNAALIFNRSDTAAVSNNITGTGSISQINSTGTVNYTGTASVAQLFVKAGTFAIGSGGNVTTSSFGGPGVAAGDNGTMTVLGTGIYTSNGDFNVGDTGSASVAAVGTLNIQDTATVSIGTAGGFFVGSAFSSGNLGTGTVNQTGGTFTDNDTADGTFVLGGRNFGTGTGTYNLSAGTATLKGLGYVGGAGTGTLNISGTGVFDAQAGLRLANNSNGQTGSAGTVNLDGGTLAATAVSAGAGTSTFNFNGGTLKADAASTTFMTGLTTANVRNGGAIIDSGVNSITIGQVLVHSTIGGDNATDGGLTKNGNGTLTLTGANTYSGNTNVNTGTLVVAGNQTGSGQLIVNNAGILQFGDGTSTNGSSVNSGTIFVNNTGTVAINKADGGTVTNQIASNPSAVTTLSGLNATGTTNTFTGTEFGNGGSFAINSTNAGAVLAFSGNSPGAIDLKATNLTVGGAGDTLFTSAGTGIYSGTNTGNTVTKNGTGTLIYQANNGYTGETDINAGAVRADVAQTNGGTYFAGNGGTTATAASVLLGGGAAGLTGGVTFNRAVSVNPGDGTTGNRVIGGTNTSGTNTFSGAVTFVGADNSGQNRSITLTAATGGTVAFTGGLTGGGFGVGQNVTKTGGGTVAIQSTASYFGTTTVSAGILAVGTAAGNGSLSNTSGVTVNSGGTLLLGGTGDRIADSAGLTLAGGKFGFDSTVTGGSETMGALTLSADSTIDFGTGNSNTLNFASLALNSHNLTVLGWTGTHYAATETADHSAGTQDRLLFNGDPTAGNTLGSISFYNDAGGLIGTGKEVSFGNGSYSFEIVPVPEPTTIFGALALLGLVGVRELRRKRRAGSE